MTPELEQLAERFRALSQRLDSEENRREWQGIFNEMRRVAESVSGGDAWLRSVIQDEAAKSQEALLRLKPEWRDNPPPELMEGLLGEVLFMRPGIQNQLKGTFFDDTEKG